MISDESEDYDNHPQHISASDKSERLAFNESVNSADVEEYMDLK